MTDREKMLREALEGLRYRPDPHDPSAPDRYCDHAAEPCPRCERARAALAAPGEREPRPDVLTREEALKILVARSICGPVADETARLRAEVERLTRERDEAAASDKESIEMYRRARDRADRAEIRRTLERIDRAALAALDDPPAAAPATPLEGYCECGHASMAHYAWGCLIVGGPHGGCGCRAFRPAVAPPPPRAEAEERCPACLNVPYLGTPCSVCGGSGRAPGAERRGTP